LLSYTSDIFNGITIDSASINSANFKRDLTKLLQSSQDKNIIWLELNESQGEEIADALSLGFKFHSCKGDTLILIFSVKSDVFIPFLPTHTVGVGAVVINDKNQILLVQERLKNNYSIYKIPGGMLDNASSLENSVIREVYEETGIKCKLLSLIAVLNTHPYRFEKSNSYYVFRLKPLSSKIDIIDTAEIEHALWCNLDSFFENKQISQFQKEIVKKAITTKGLVKQKNSLLTKPKKISELYL